MHAEALERWYVPQIFAALPLLLQIGLILFLVGLADFLWHLNHSVAIPVLMAIGATLLFLFVTTVLPTFQVLTLFLPRWSSNPIPRVECPYKSPQSWAVRQLFAPFVNVIMRLLAVKVDTEKQLDLHTTISLFRPAGTLPRATEIIFRNKRDDTWLEHSLGWLFQRDIDSMAAYPDLSHLTSAMFLRRPFPVYDAMQALIHAKKAAPSRVHDELIAVEAWLHHVLQLSNDVPLVTRPSPMDITFNVSLTLKRPDRQTKKGYLMTSSFDSFHCNDDDIF